MIEFELRKASRDDISTDIIDGVDSVIFTITPIVGIKGCTYPGFECNNKTIKVVCNKELKGSEMEQQILEESLKFVSDNFKTIE